MSFGNIQQMYHVFFQIDKKVKRHKRSNSLGTSELKEVCAFVNLNIYNKLIQSLFTRLIKPLENIIGGSISILSSTDLLTKYVSEAEVRSSEREEPFPSEYTVYKLLLNFGRVAST